MKYNPNGKIRVAHIINYLAPAGKEMGIVKLLNHTDPDKFEGYLIVLDRVFDSLILDTDRTKLVSINKKKGNDPTLPFRLAHILRKYKIDIVHTHAWGTLVEGIVAAKIARVPVTIHGEHGTFHKDPKRKFVQKLMFKLCDKLLSVSGVLAEDLANSLQLPQNSFYPILNGVDSNKYFKNEESRKKYRGELSCSDDTVLIGSVGRTVKVKNHQVLIKAAKKLKEKNLNFLITIIGDSPEKSLRPYLQEEVEKAGVSELVKFLGNKNDVPGYLSAFDIFVLPSLSEGCSNVIQEAMATELPVVASNVGGNPELVSSGKTGYLFDLDNLDELVEKLEKLITEELLRKEIGERAKKEMLNRFSLEKMVENYESFYSDALNEK
ncbi:MAG: glycosyltransferase [Calditrichaeota bacterium]|nr:MAG: glycosyltransferase [Calditrichota bacterium]MBL1206347.1 glycosyltransferase [Calditrichota bacterium]NOG46173.1 glycosyltransferase [Calditrichota bacterium]